jgi:hypothetical protein
MFEHIYITGLGIAGYVMFCVPLALFATWLIYWLGLSKLSQPALRRSGAVLTAGFLLSLPLWDIVSIGIEANQLCKQTGLRIYRTVEADGFLGDSSIEIWSRLGYRYVESGGADKKSLYTMRDGKVVHQRIQGFSSRYQSKTGDNHVVIGKHFSRSSHQVVDRQTDEVLGELVVVSIYPGWLDNIVIGLTGTGSGFSPWKCGDKPPAGSDILRFGGSDVVRATLQPQNIVEKQTK